MICYMLFTAFFFRFVFRNSKKQYVGIPVVASNMDTVGTFEMAEALAKHKLFTTVHKHYTFEQWIDFVDRIGSNPNVSLLFVVTVCRFLFYRKNP